MLMFAAIAVPFAARQDVFVTLCRTHFTVTDAHGRAVTGLSRDDVTVYDNDVPQPLSEFVPHPDAPVSVALLIDRSQSVSDRLPLLTSAASAFETAMLRNNGDRSLLVAFDSHAFLLQDWTDDVSRIVGHINALTAAGGTSIFDALFKTCRDRFDITDMRHNVVVLITDGEDTTSIATFDQALQMTTLSRVVVYVIGVKAERSLNTREWQGRRVLSGLADLTGGRLFYPDEQRENDFATLFGRVQEEISSTYTATYYLDTMPDNSFHRIRVETRDKSLTVHAPSGYILRAPPQAP